MTKKILNISEYYIKKQEDKIGLVTNNGDIDETAYSEEGHGHIKNDISDFSHSHGNISNNGTLSEINDEIINGDNDYLLYTDNSNKIKGGKQVGTKKIKHSGTSFTELKTLTVQNPSQHALNVALYNEIASLKEKIDSLSPSDDGESAPSISKTDIVDLIYPVGSIYMSIESTSPAELFGGTWEQLEDRFLLGAGSEYSRLSGHDKNAVAIGGSADAIVVEHNHEQEPHNHDQVKHTHEQEPHNHDQVKHTHEQYPHTHEQYSHTHVQYDHNHEQDAHNHEQNAHNHTQNGHNHTTDNGLTFLASNTNVAINGTKRDFPKEGGNKIHIVYAAKNGDIQQRNVTNSIAPGINNATPTNKSFTATNQPTTAINKAYQATNKNYTAVNKEYTAVNKEYTAVNKEYTASNIQKIALNKSTGQSGTKANLPPYLIVYMWERVADETEEEE